MSKAKLSEADLSHFTGSENSYLHGIARNVLLTDTVYAKRIEYTDFPAERITLWFENNTIYLPSER